MLSPQSKYALRAVLFLQEQDHGHFVRVEEIARETDLPAPYLSKILKLLVADQIILSRRGKNGGVQLNRSRRNISFLQICGSVGDPIVRSECVLFKKSCDKNNPCPFHGAWSDTKAQLLAFLRDTSVD